MCTDKVLLHAIAMVSPRCIMLVSDSLTASKNRCRDWFTASANDETIAASIRQSRLIYLLGGFTGYLGETLANSASYRAMLTAYEAGAVIAGSSAGAMMLCQYYFDPAKRQIVEGLNFVPNTCV